MSMLDISKRLASMNGRANQAKVREEMQDCCEDGSCGMCRNPSKLDYELYYDSEISNSPDVRADHEIANRPSGLYEATSKKSAKITKSELRQMIREAIQEALA